MRKKILYSFFFLIVILIIGNINSYASTSATFFDGKIPKISDTQNIEILSNDIKIDTINSTINNTLILKNTSNNKITTNIDFPLENKELSTSVSDVQINVNNLDITKYIENNSGNYAFKIEIPANESKKIIVNYKTENDLQNAKVIKYSLDNLYGKIVKNLNVNIIIKEKDIPLVKAIYPNVYTFDNNTINVNYYDFKVNNLTKDIIVEKETYKNLLYGQDVKLSDNDKIVLDNFDEWITNGFPMNYSKYISETSNVDATKKFNAVNFYNIYKSLLKEQSSNEYNLSDISLNIIEYAVDKQLVKDGRNNNMSYTNMLSYSSNGEIIKYNPLVEDFLINNYKTKNLDLKNKKICIDYKPTEEGKELYVYKNTSGEQLEDNADELVKESEEKILETNYNGNGFADPTGARIIFIGKNIDGTNIDATDSEKLEYASMINSDMYLVIELYDGYDKNKYLELFKNSYDIYFTDGVVGYYNDNNYDIVKKFMTKSKQESESEFQSDKYNSKKFESYQEYLNSISQYYKNFIVKINTNEEMSKSPIPTVIQFLGYVSNENGKNIVTYFASSGMYMMNERGLVTTKAALEISQAKKLLEDNKNKNETTKNEIDSEIANIKITNDTEEFYKKAEHVNIEELQENTSLKEKLTKFISENKDVIILSIIGLSIFICIIILIRKSKKSKNRKLKKI